LLHKNLLTTFAANTTNMQEQADAIIQDTATNMQKAINHLEAELTKIRAGKASVNMVDGIMVDYYGSPTAVNQVGNVAILDARTLGITPWEKNMIQPIERAIIAANIGINPQNDGNIIRLFLPPLTEERRKELVKKSNAEGEQAKIAIRSIRRDAIEQVKKLEKDGLSEDAAKDAETDTQTTTDKFITLIEKLMDAKEKEIMAV
jgi:ribosome recycling factor